MAVYSYAAKSLAGEELKGSREAKDKFELAKSLRDEGYILISSEEAKPGLTFRLPSFLMRVSTAEKMIFSRNLAVMIAAGLALARSLEVLAKESHNHKFQEALLSLAASIKKGSNFSEALKNFPNIFPPLFQAMVAAGEKTGKLEESLKLISHQLKREYDLKRKIRGALIYPAVILVAMFGIGILMLVYVVPTLVQTFRELNIKLPTSTRLIITVSNFFLNNLILGSILFIIFLAALYFASRSEKGHRFIDFTLLKIPVIAGLVKKTNSARTCRTLGSLIGAGVEILEALGITSGVLQNHYYREVVLSAQKSIEKGEPISKIFIQRSELYPSLVGEMMAVGEETGKLSEMLFRLAVFYEGEVTATTKDLSTIIEPALMIIIGVVVGLFAFSMIQPLYSVVGTL